METSNHQIVNIQEITKAIPPPTDRITHSMTQHIKALAATGMKMRVKEALKSAYANEWIQAINLEINSLINDFKCLVPEDIDHGK
jgi:hypothetical protein